MKGWQAYGLAAFAVAAGQVLKLGRKIEAGEPIGPRDIFVLFSLLPAFGSMIGAAAEHYGAPTWMILASGVSAGWIGFGTMRFVLAIVRAVWGQLGEDRKP